MSAYVVKREHILYLLEAAQARRLNPHDYEFSWRYKGNRMVLDRRAAMPSGEVRSGIQSRDVGTLQCVAQMLWNANVHAVAIRYPDSKKSLPGPEDSDYMVRTQDVVHKHWNQFAFDPVTVLKAIECYDYQTCEDPDYESSEAYAFLRALERRAIRALPGWEDAPWGAPQPNKMAVNPPAGPR